MPGKSIERVKSTGLQQCITKITLIPGKIKERVGAPVCNSKSQKLHSYLIRSKKG